MLLVKDVSRPPVVDVEVEEEEENENQDDPAEVAVAELDVVAGVKQVVCDVCSIVMSTTSPGTAEKIIILTWETLGILSMVARLRAV